MHIELTFRDWKTHLGIRGLRLEIDIAPRLERLLLALTVAYILAVLLGAGPTARRVRADCEILRATPRHGTRRRLSALSVGILLLSLARFAALAARARGRPPPSPSARRKPHGRSCRLEALGVKACPGQPPVGERALALASQAWP
jgi:hypothetical protein